MFTKPATVRLVLIAAFALCSLAITMLISGFPSEANSAANALVPVINAVKSVGFAPSGDVDVDGRADPGDTLQYTVTISNTGADPATGVTINDTLQNITTLVGSSVVASPIAVNDTFGSIGNVGISVPAGSGVLVNDLNPNGGGTLMVQSVNQAGLQGTLSLNTTTGSFDFTPNPGFEGATSFTYTLANGTGLTDTATVTITVSGMIWFIDNSAVAAGDGRLGSPFNSLANFVALAADDAGDNIFVYRQSASNYTGGVTLLANQRLIGQGATATLVTITGFSVPAFSNALPATSGTRPTLTHSNNNVILSTGNTLRGLNIQSTGGSALFGTSFNNLTALENTASATGGTAAVNLNQASGTASINVTFISVAASASTNGIILADTTGSFTVTGDGTNTTQGGNASGGTIQGITGATESTAGNGAATNGSGIGVFLSNAANVSLRRMTFTGSSNFGLNAQSVTGLTLQYCRFNGVHGDDGAQDEGSLRMLELRGTNLIDNCDIRGGIENNVRLDNDSGTLAGLTVSNNTIRDSSTTASGNDNVQVDLGLTASVTNLTVNNNTFAATNGDHIDVNVAASVVASLVAIQNNNCSGGGGASALGQGLRIAGAGAFTGTVNFNISGNTLNGTIQGGAINVPLSGGTASTGTFSGTINNNTIGTAAVANSGCAQCSGIIAANFSSGTFITAITNNQVRQFNSNGIQMTAGNAGVTTGGVYQATVTGNTVANPGVNGLHGIDLNSGTVAGNAYQVCSNLSSNNVVGGSVPANGGSEIQLRQRQATTVRLPGYGGANNNNAAVATFIAGQNTVTGVASVIASNSVPTGGGFVGGAACNAPAAFAETVAGNSNQVSTNEIANNDITIGPEHGISRESASLSNTIASIGNTARRIYYGLSEAISPTVTAQEAKSQTAAPESGETVTKSLGTLPAGEQIVVQFRATVDNGPYQSGVNDITNTATISGSNFANVISNTTSIVLDAAPDLSLTKTEGGSTTQPGVTVVYTLNYSNITSPSGQNAVGVTLTETVPVNTTFNAVASLPSVWSCADGSAAGTSCTLTVGNLNAGAGGSATFAVNVLGALPAGVTQVSNSSSVAEAPNVNGTDPVPANNTGPDTTNIIGNWDGSASADWHTATNWSNDIIPPVGNNVSVPNVANPPTVTTSDVILNNLVLNGQNVSIGVGRTITATGTVTLGTNNVSGAGLLSLGGAATITRTTGQVNSTLQKTFTSTGLFIFPVGTTGAYSPVDVNVTAGTGQLSVRANTGTAPATIPLNAATTLQRYWTLNGSGITSDVTWHYLQADVAGNETAYHMIRVPDSGSPVTRFAPNGTTRVLDTTNNFFRMTGVSVYSHWTAGEPLAPTAANASVSGRVMNDEGRGVAGAVVEMADQNGNAVYAITNPFGYYRFVNIPVGQSYVASVRSKRYTFAPQVIAVNDDIAGLDFVPEQ